MHLSVSDPQCSPVKCDAGCRLNYDAKPCPVCQCEESNYHFLDIIKFVPDKNLLSIKLNMSKYYIVIIKIIKNISFNYLIFILTDCW